MRIPVDVMAVEFIAIGRQRPDLPISRQETYHFEISYIAGPLGYTLIAKCAEAHVLFDHEDGRLQFGASQLTISRDPEWYPNEG